ncbi:MAG TPA: dockerin type I repeat-containing protein, partial [candidate division Zixibacteria bacterium]|nr:dockerin type I repeat-containing protein [candidate division Zixibacteria bacterium]
SCCIKRGDIDHNGTIDIADLIAMVEYAFGINTPPDLCPEEADVNGDGTVDMADIIRLVEFSFIINAPPPAPCYGN